MTHALFLQQESPGSEQLSLQTKVFGFGFAPGLDWPTKQQRDLGECIFTASLEGVLYSSSSLLHLCLSLLSDLDTPESGGWMW